MINRATAVSIQANRPYLDALKILASRRDTTVAKLVRAAVDKAHGDELTLLSSFFEGSVQINGRSSDKLDNQS